MDVLLTEEEEMLKNSAREFLEAECSPEMVRAMEKDDLGYPPNLWNQMASLGWVGMALPERYGGQGLSLTYLGIVMEEVGRHIVPVPLHSTMTAALTINADGTEEQRRETLSKVCNGDMVLTWAFIEADPRFRAESVKMEAKQDGDSYILNGSKMFVENFNAAQKCIVVCRTTPGSTGKDGISVLLVDANTPGISHEPLTTLAKDKQSRVAFKDVRVPGTAIIGEAGEGWPIAEQMLDRATALLCTQLVGAARKDAEMAIEYSKNRVAFGRPIASFQSIQHICADMILWIDGGQLLTYEALWRMDQGLPAGIEVSQAKAFCNEKCEATVRSSQIIHGGIGFMMEFNLHLWFRRVTAWTLRLGTTFEHRAKVARALLDQPGKMRLGQSVYQTTLS